MENFEKALQYAFLLLRYRDRSVHELLGRLQKKKYTKRVREKVVERLKEHSYLDDARFARMFIKERLCRGYGRRRITFDLTRFGIDKELIAESLAAVEERRYQIHLKALIRKRIARYKDTEKGKLKSKLFRYFAQRGFEFEYINSALGHILG